MSSSEDVEWLIENYLRSDSDAKRFRVLAKISNNGLLFVYLGTVAVTLVSAFILDAVPQFPNQFAGINDFIALLSVAIGLLSSILILFAANDHVDRVLGKQHLSPAAHPAGDDHVDILLPKPLR